jgi:RHS repeat-associated protein
VGQCRLVLTVELGAHGPTRVVDEESARVGIAREAHYVYANGRLASAKTPFELERGLPGTRYEYGSAGRVRAVTSSEGERVEYHWLFGWLWQIEQIGEGDPAHRFTHPGEVAPDVYAVTHTHPLGGRTRWVFTAAGHVLAIERLDAGEVLSVEWDVDRNRAVRIVGFDGAARHFEDWVDDDPGRVIEPSGNVVTVGYEPAGVDRRQPLRRPIRSLSDSLGAVLAVGYDAAGRPESWQNGEGEVVAAGHLGGRISDTLAPWGAVTEFTSYGVHGHWRSAQRSTAPELPVHRRFDRVGNLLVPAAGLQPGGVLERAYDPDRRLAGIDLAGADDGGAPTTTDAVAIERRSDGRPLEIRRPHGADHQLEYDALGRLERLREWVDGAWTETIYEYDLAGNPTRIQQPNGVSEELDYDAYGRTLERRVLRDGTVEAFARFERSRGRLDRWYDSVRDQWESFDYDVAGRPERVVYSGLGESIAFEYDLRSRVTKKTFRIAAIVRELETEWDLADRRTRVFTRDAGGDERDLVRPVYAQGRLAALEYGNGLRREHVYGAEGRFAGYRTTQILTGALVEESSIELRREFGPARLEVTSRSETVLATSEEVYGLSPGGSLQTLAGLMGARVFRWQARTWIGGLIQDEDARVYAWDERSNPVDDSDGDAFVYNAERNRLVSATVGGVSHTYSYDESGFVTSRDGLEIGWTATGRLARVGSETNPLALVAWDLADRPVRIEALGWLHLAHVSLPFAGEERAYRHLDPLGNVGFLSDEQGQVTSHRRYQPFGLDRVYGLDDPDEGHHASFARGVELRANGLSTGLVLLGARVLDSEVGRFLSQDPVLQLVSQYSYALGNPVQYEDADGRSASVKPEVRAAQLEARAAQLGVVATQLDINIAQIGVATSLLTFATAATGNPVGVGIALAAGAIAASVVNLYAASIRAEISSLRAQASAIRAAALAGAARDRVPPRPPQRGRLEIGIEGVTSPAFLLPLAPLPEIALPPVCGPSTGSRSPQPQAALALALLGLVALLALAGRERRA